MYRIRTYPEAEAQIAALPSAALPSYAQVLAVLMLVPWNGSPFNGNKPDGNMRQFTFGSNGNGFVVYMILEDQLFVDVLRVVWLG